MTALLSIRLVISDIDGTLVRQDKSLADATIAAFGRLRDAGIQATLISARAPSGMFSLAEALDITIPLGAFNGGTIFERNGALLAWSRLDRAVTRTVLTLSEKTGVDVWLFSEGKWYARTLDNPRIAHERLSSGLEPTLVSDLANVAGEADKIICVSEDGELLRSLEENACAATGVTTTIAQSQSYYLDITARVANKGNGIVILADAAAVTLDQVAVIGDMPNDLPMFAGAGLSIAIGQAPEAVRRCADFVTASNEEDGVARAIDGLILPHTFPE